MYCGATVTHVFIGLDSIGLCLTQTEERKSLQPLLAQMRREKILYEGGGPQMLKLWTWKMVYLHFVEKLLDFRIILRLQ